MRRFVVVIVALCSFCGLTRAEDWAQFRGPAANGVTEAESYPQQWNSETNIRWSADLPHPGNGSAIVSGDRVFVTSAEDSRGHGRSLICFAADTGRKLWAQTVTLETEMPTHKTNPHGGGTPACDGKHVVVWHATAGLHAYDLQGDPLWSRDLGEFRHMWGYGSSPIIVDDRVILNSGPGKNVFVAAFDVKSGRTLWKHDEPVEGDGEHNSAGKYMGTWSTPVPITRDGKTMIVVAMHRRILGLNAETGSMVWSFTVDSDRGELAYSAPMIEGDRCYFNAGFKGPMMAFDIRGTGDITDREVWRIESNPQSIGTGVVLGGYIYRIGAGPNLIECLDADSGEIVWQHRNKAAFWGSISLSGDVAYATDQSGNTVVFRPSPDGFERIAECPLDDASNATPALAGGRIYLRTNKKLWCIQ